MEPEKNTFSSLCLFAGIGGMGLATEWAGGHVAAFSEIAEFPCNILKQRWPDVPNLGDFRNIIPNEYIETFGHPCVITAGIPCQPASLAGKRMGESDERWMWPATIDLIGRLRPDFALIENPVGIFSLDGGSSIRSIMHQISEIGYDAFWTIVPAAAVGAGHKRERLWIVLASNSDLPGLERHARNEVFHTRKIAYRQSPAKNLLPRECSSEKWYHKPGIQFVVNGVSRRMAREKLIAIGNTIVPQVAHIFMQSIADSYV